MQRILEPEVMDTEEDTVEYTAMDHSQANEAFVQRLLELKAVGRMLDIGTGPGHIPVLVCERILDAHVTGIDLAQRMLAIAQQNRFASKLAERLEFRLADAKQSDFPDASFDTVFSNTILHHIPDPRTLLREAVRLRKPGGTLLIRDLYRPSSPARVAELVAEHAPDATSYQRNMFHASLCAALTPDELRAMAQECGLESAELVLDTDRHMSLQIAADPR